MPYVARTYIKIIPWPSNRATCNWTNKSEG